MCGEKAFWPSPPTGNTGSPPHVRGKGLGGFVPLEGVRITPACAGKSVTCRNTSHILKDHPRMCGEKYKVDVDGENVKGSPPHVRGKGRSFELPVAVDRITPACAGKSH